MLDDARRWFAGARFGLFMHWGMYALYGRGEQVLFREHLTPSEYRRRANEFNPKSYDPTEWAEAAKEAGMRYAVLTAKHHDGYCLFDSQWSDFTSTKTGPQDPVFFFAFSCYILLCIIFYLASCFYF